MTHADRTTLNLVAAPVFILHPGPRGLPVYDFVNQAWLGSVDRRADDVLGRDASQVFEGPAGIEIRDHQRDAFATGQTISYDVTLSIRGTAHRVRTELSPLRDDDGKITEIVGTKLDQAEIARAHDLHADAHEMAAEIEAFISLAAHDLRAPMRQVRLLAEMLREDGPALSEEQSFILDKLAGVATKSSEMISDILSHAQAVSAGAEASDVRLGCLIADVLMVLDPLRRHSVLNDDVSMVVDRTTLQVVLRNLFDNAFKHARRDGVTLQVEVEEISGGMLHFTVSDSGDGFPDPSVAFLQEGVLRPDSGFGLAGVRRLVRSRGGTIFADNRADGGAEINFTLAGLLTGQISQADKRLAS